MRVGVLISGTGSNLQALIDDGGIEIACVASNVADAPGLARATAAGIPVLAAVDERETADSSNSTASALSSWPATCGSSRPSSYTASTAGS